MKQKVLIAAGQSVFEFEGEITEFNDSYLVLKAKHGDVYIERKFLVFIQFLDEEPEVKAERVKSPEVDMAAKFINKRLRHDPVDEILEEKFVPPSQLTDDDDAEVMRNIVSGKHMWNDTAITNATDLQQAVKTAMENEDHDFSMGMGSSKYKDPAQIVLGMKNANNKKS